MGVVPIPVFSSQKIIDSLHIFFHTFLNSQRLHYIGEESVLYPLPIWYHRNVCKL